MIHISEVYFPNLFQIYYFMTISEKVIHTFFPCPKGSCLILKYWKLYFKKCVDALTTYVLMYD